jgi:hypothetical protein
MGNNSGWTTGCGAVSSAGIEPESRHHGSAGGGQLGRDDAGEGMRRVAIAPRPRQRDAWEFANVAHPIIDADDIAHVSAGSFRGRFGMVVDRIRLELTPQAKALEMFALEQTSHRSLARHRQQARAEHEFAGADRRRI